MEKKKMVADKQTELERLYMAAKKSATQSGYVIGSDSHRAYRAGYLARATGEKSGLLPLLKKAIKALEHYAKPGCPEDDYLLAEETLRRIKGKIEL